MADSGLFHTLQAIDSFDALMTHPKLGASWEGFVVGNVFQILGIEVQNFYFYGTHSGVELDLFWQNSGKNYGIEIKFADAPTLTTSMKKAMEDLQLHRLWVIYPGPDLYQLDTHVTSLPLKDLRTIQNA